MTREAMGQTTRKIALAPGMAFGYGEFTLPAPWGDWIETGWWFTRAADGADATGPAPPVPPSTRPNIVAVCQGTSVRWVGLRGPHRETRFTPLEPGALIVGLRLWPDALSSLLGESIAAWQDRVEPLESVIGSGAADHWRTALAGVLDGSPTADALGHAAADWLATLDREHHPPIDPCVRSALLLIASSAGGLTVGAIAERLQLSRRTLERRTRAATDTTVKLLLREARVAAAVRRMHGAPTARAAAISAELGFVDQSHLTREVAAILGTTTQRLRSYLADVAPPEGGRRR